MSRVKPFEKNLGQKERERERRRKQEERQVPKRLRREAAEMEESSVAAACGGATSKSTGVGGGSKCGRWNPTAEQVKVLTELFRAGLRTPTTEQIQRISSHLSVFGKIESKNVFYWFQNHKARERLHHKKRRRGPPYFSSYYPDCTDIFPTLPHDQSARRGAVCSGIGNGSGNSCLSLSLSYIWSG